MVSITSNRHRSRGAINPEPTGSTIYKTYANGSTSSNPWAPPGNPTYGEGHEESMYDIVTKNFRKRIAAGEVIVNPMIKYDQVRTHSYGNLEYFKTVNQAPLYKETTHIPYCAAAIYYTGGELNHLTIPIDAESLWKQAGTSARAGINDPELEGLAFLGELRESIQFLKSPLRKWQDLVKKAKRDARRKKRNPKSLKLGTVADHMASNWLGYRMAVRPIVSETQDAARAVAATYLDHKPLRRISRGYANDSGSDSLETTHNVGALLEQTREVSTTRNYEVRAGVLYEVQRRNAGQEFGLSAERLPRALWEVTPFSWVVDYFANVGSYIGAIEPKIGVRTLGEWTVVRDSTKSEASCYYSKANSNYTITDPCHSSLGFESSRTYRVKGVLVGLVLKPTPIRGWSGAAKVTDLIAVTNQILASRLR